jgi:hypothetical protein
MPLVLIRFLSACAAIQLAGCSSTPSPLVSQPQRAGAEQSAPLMQTLPPSARNRQYDPGVAPANEEKGQKVGTVVTTQGGQKTQQQDKEKEERAALEKEQARQRASQSRQQSPDERTTSP